MDSYIVASVLERALTPSYLALPASNNPYICERLYEGITFEVY